MADSGGRGEGEVDTLLVSENGGQPPPDMNENNRLDDNRASKSASRFKVARVDFKENADEEPKVAVKEKHPTVAFVVGEDETVPGSPTAGDTHVGSYDTHNQRTFAHNTLETLPHLDHYRNLLSATGAMRQRPTLLELHELELNGGDGDNLEVEGQRNGAAKDVPNGQVEPEPGKNAAVAVKFGWITGVLVRCLLNIYGVMLFLRLSWVVGQAGLMESILIILTAAIVTTVTTLSMAAICTNGDIKGGGAYFMISRCLGPEFGGAIGIVFCIANAVAIAMYVVGFAETIRDVLKELDCLMVDESNDVRIIGLICITGLLCIACMGMAWEAKAQLVLLAVLMVSLINFFAGTLQAPSPQKYSQGFTGYKSEVMKENFFRDYRDGESFFSVFAVFFPAATGILAGANISGDLKDAQKAIPKGTLLAILISTLTYICMACMAAGCVVRDAGGFVMESAAAAANTTMFSNDSDFGEPMVGGGGAAMYMYGELDELNDTALHNPILYAGNGTYCVPGVDCQYGLINNMQVMMMVSGAPYLTIAGIISATLSSALASLVSAPKVFQAVCKDKLFPGIHIFAKGYGPSDEPYRAYGLAFFVGAVCICIGDLNVIAPLISNFFLMSYALINYACFDASLSRSPGWRPAFHYYSMWVAALGSFLCLVIMFITSWITGFATVIIIGALYMYTHYTKPEVNWGSSRQAHCYRSALQNALQLVSTLEHVKTYRPQLMVLTGFPNHRPALVDFATSISKGTGLMVCGHVILNDALKDNRRTTKLAYNWLVRRKSKGFYTAVCSPSLRQGVAALLQCCGVGKMKPNTLLLGFKHNWQSCDPKDVDEYFNIIHDAFSVNCGVGVLRVADGLDYAHVASLLDKGSLRSASSEESLKEATPPPNTQSFIESTPLRRNAQSTDTLLLPSTGPLNSSQDTDNISRDYVSCSDDEGLNDSRDDLDCMDQSREDLDQVERMPMAGDNRDQKNMQQFHRRKQKKGFVDVWWMFDDGGLTLLIPYILSTKRSWKGCKLRVFMAGTKNKELDRDQRHLATLLSKFRIEYSSMTVIPDIGKKAKEQNWKDFRELIQPWMLAEGETQEQFPWKITESELAAQKDKTNRQLRMNEVLQEHSRDSTLIVMTLPMPRQGLCSAGLYMGWIETITKDLPPILLLRGNQESVLTYYS